MTFSTNILLVRGLEEWELECEFDIEGPDHSVGLGGAAMLLKAETYNPNTGKWMPFALTDAEMERLEVIGFERWDEWEPDFDDGRDFSEPYEP